MTAGRFDMLRHWPLIAAGISALMLATAHGFETFGGLAPCELCLHQREVYWAAMPVGLIGFVAARMLHRRWAPPLACWLLAAVFLFGAGLAAYHAGVEWKWWPGPQSCTGGGQVTASAMADLLAGKKIAPPQCDKAAWRWLGLSMAGWNALISLGLAGLSAWTALRPEARPAVGVEPA
jgi:disulfide bond formation protein DsbB